MPTGNSSDSDFVDLPETPDTNGAYPRLADEQVTLLSRYGERKHVAVCSSCWTGASECSTTTPRPQDLA